MICLASAPLNELAQGVSLLPYDVIYGKPYFECFLLIGIEVWCMNNIVVITLIEERV